MPITLRPVSRRRFLRGATATVGAAALVGCKTGPQSRSSTPTSPVIDHFAVLSDTHVNADLTKVQTNVNMADHLRSAVAQVLALPDRPSHVVVNGDLAHVSGEPGDYAALVPLLQPLGDAGLPVTASLGNHDHRDHFLASARRSPSVEPVEGKHVSVVRGRTVDLVVLDTLDRTNVTPGLLGDAQLRWLTATLDASTDRDRDRHDKPVVVFMHHNPEPPVPATTKPATGIGLTDTKPLLDLLLPRRNVKALVTGHLHRWTTAEVDGLHFVSLPATAYVFDPKEPSGWVDWHVDARGARLTLRTIDPADPRDGQVIDLPWRRAS